MFALLLLAAAPSTPPSLAEDKCRAGLAARLGELGTFAPGPGTRHRRTTVIRGVVDGLAKAPPPAPGMMAPTHVLVTRYSFRCELRSGVVRSISVRRKSQ